MCDYLGKCHLGDDQAFTFRGKGLAPPHVFVALPLWPCVDVSKNRRGMLFI